MTRGFVNRRHAAAMGRETLEIVRRGSYVSPDGREVEVGAAIEHARQASVTYPPDRSIPRAGVGRGIGSAPRSEPRVANQSTLEAARELLAAEYRPAALNFASVRHPGGGSLSGARAQEESLARSSGLFACLEGNEMYAFHEAYRDCLYTSYAIYSPDVPVFRDDEGTLLETPWPCSFLTCAAANAKVVLSRDRSRRGDIHEAMRERVDRVLAIAAAHGHDALVLGAWGCGVFGNDGDEIAGLFCDALEGPFAGVFARVTFAVLDWSEERRFIGPFERAFGSA